MRLGARQRPLCTRNDSNVAICAVIESGQCSLVGRTVVSSHSLLYGFELEHPLEIELVLEFAAGSWLPLLILSVEVISPLHEARFRSQIRLAGWNSGFILNFNATRLKDGLRQVGLNRKDASLT